MKSIVNGQMSTVKGQLSKVNCLSSGIAALPLVLMLGGLITQISIALLISNFLLLQSELGLRYNSQALAAAQTGIQDGILRVIRDKTFSSSYTITLPDGSTADVSVCTNTPDPICIGADRGRVISVGKSHARNKKLQAILDVSQVTGAVKVVSLSELTFSVVITVPGAPTSLVATAGNTQATLTWIAPASNGGAAITNYKVYRSTTLGAGTPLSTGGCSALTNVLTCTDIGLTNGTTYYYKVSAVNSVGESILSDEASATPALNRIFVTNTLYNGNLGGLAGADSKCAASATAASLTGTWKAWLSDSVTSASGRLTKNSGYKNMNNQIVANSWSGLTSGTLLAPIQYTETNANVNFEISKFVFTGTNSAGNKTPSTGDSTRFCGDWTSTAGANTIGNSLVVDFNWTQYDGGNVCSDPFYRLYCVEQ